MTNQTVEDVLTKLEGGAVLLKLIEQMELVQLREVVTAQSLQIQKLGLAVSAHKTFFELMRAQASGDGEVQ